MKTQLHAFFIHCISKHNDYISKILGMILEPFSTRSPEVLKKVFKARVCCILEFGSILWNPYVKSATEKIKKVQKRFTRSCHTCALPCRERLEKLSVTD